MTLSDLNNAFLELERRADACDDVSSALHHPRDHRRSRPLLIGASVTAVAAVAAIGVALGTSGGSRHQVAGADPAPSADVALSSAAPSQTSSNGTDDLPRTQAALVARFRSILADTATFTVDHANSTRTLITGVLTSSAGTRGLYVLEIDKTDLHPTDAGKPTIPTCRNGVRTTTDRTGSRTVTCGKTTTLSDRSTLHVDPTYPDGPVDGVMNDAIRTRPDGWQISLYTANVESKTFGAPVLGSQPALSTKQVTDVVTSPQWY